MAMYILPKQTFTANTPVTANGCIGLTSSATTIDRVVEVLVGGEATTSSAQLTKFARHSTVGATPVAVTPGKLNPRSAAAAAAGFSSFSSAAVVGGTLVQLSFNAFGGVVRWVAAPGEELYFVGGTAADTEGSINGTGVSGSISAHVIFEEL